jgi:hypothetical protein
MHHRATLQANQLATAQTFDLQKGKSIPPTLLPYMRLAMSASVQEIQQVRLVLLSSDSAYVCVCVFLMGYDRSSM